MQQSGVSPLELRYVDPFDPDCPHLPQQQLLNIKTDGPGITLLDFISGRGGGKTAVAVLKVLDVCISDPGTTGLVLAPTYQMLQRSFVREWIDAVPPEIYKYNKQQGIITLINGSKFFLASRNVDNPSRGKNVTRGLTVDWCVDDEAALGYDPEMYANTMACIRGQGQHKFYACFTTPRLDGSGFYDLVHDEKTPHQVVHSTSKDNPFNQKEFVKNVESQMTEMQAQREIYGQWVVPEGRVWKDWLSKPWPDGNIYDWTFQPGRPWYCFLDLGSATAAYVVVQLVSDSSFGMGRSRDIWVACAELTPDKDGSAAAAFKKMRQRFGTPAIVVGGHDMKTRASTDGLAPDYFAVNIFGGGVDVRPVTGIRADKTLQVNALEKAICDPTGHRKFCVASNFETIGAGRVKRGINELMTQDTWPDNAGRAKSQLLNKEGRLEHIRDALLYGAVELMEPPMWAPDRRFR